MSLRRLLLIGLVSGTTLFAQPKEGAESDYVTSHPEFYKVLLENDRVRVLEYTLEPGRKEGWHTHPNMVLYVLEGGTIRAEFEAAPPMAIDEVVGAAKYVAATPKHTAHNTGKSRIRILVTELK